MYPEDLKDDPARFTVLHAAFQTRTKLVGDGRTVDSARFYFAMQFVAFTLSDGSVEIIEVPPVPSAISYSSQAPTSNTPEAFEALDWRRIGEPDFIPPLPAPGFTHVDAFGDWNGYFTADQATEHAQAAVSLVIDAFAKLLPCSYYMDPPDGGSVSVLEQMGRMAEDADKWRELDTIINGVPTGAVLPQLVEQLRARQPVQILNLPDGMRVNFRAPDGQRATLHLGPMLDAVERDEPLRFEPDITVAMRAAMAAYPVAGEAPCAN